MKIRMIKRLFPILASLALVSLACMGGGNIQTVTTQPQAPQVPQATPISGNKQAGSSRAQLIAATVQIYGLQTQNGKLTPIYSGSGTILSPTGMILTNAHVASPASQGNTQEEPQALAIGLMDKEDKPPVFLYFAKVLAVDGYMDLAVIQIDTTLDGTKVNPNSLSLPYVSLGNSDNLHVGDHINIFGFPGIGGETITYTDGSVSGFTTEEGLGDRAWIKTDATIAGGNSGGLAADDAGYIIGVPTSASAGTGGDITDCRVVQDTNGDGVMDSRDTCIPIGGFINGLRSVNLALPLIKAAQSGQQYTSPFGGPSQASSSGSGSEAFSQIAWFTGTGGADCKPGSQVNTFPSGTTAIAAAFNFSGMTDGEPWGERWTSGGQELYKDQYSWNKGSQGTTFTCIFSQQNPLPDGTYHLELYAGQQMTMLTQGDVTVGGGGGQTNPGTGQGVVTLYGLVYDASSNNPLSGATIFILKPGLTYAQFKADNYPDSDVYSVAKTDNRGNYTIPDKLALNVGYTVVAYMDGYKIQFGDNLVWTSSDPVNYQMDIGMSN